MKTFATEVGACDQKIILLVQDRDGWHSSPKVELPAGIIGEFLPPYSRLTPTVPSRLWSLVDEPLVNEHFESLDELEDVLATRCCVLQTMSHELKNITNSYWFNWG